ncbi:unnamed protein product [Durusdinium trenchii]|uniref:Pentatricopeptide repeat-containing protein, chloroplastic n=1 Tax=Durusdinium trenchii TaxID=1381693 RepID=A0ABP0SZB9_9DINO
MLPSPGLFGRCRKRRKLAARSPIRGPCGALKEAQELTVRLSRLARKNDWRRAADAVTQASGLSDARGETAKMTALAAAGRWFAAWHHLQRLFLVPTLRVDVVMLNVVLSAGATSSPWQMKRQALQTLREKGVDPDARSVLRLMGGPWLQARSLLRQLGQQVEMNLIVMNAALAAGAQELKDLQSWRLERLEPDVISFNTCADLAIKAGRWPEAQQMLQDLKDEDLQPNVVSMNLKLAASSWPKALHLQGTSGVQLDLVSFSSTLAACERKSHWIAAVEVLEVKRQRSTLADAVCFNSAVSACCKGETCRWSHGLQIFAEHIYGQSDEEIAGTALLAACQRQEEWPWCLQLLEFLERKRGRADRAAYTATLLACAKALQMATSTWLLDAVESEPNMVVVNVQVQLHQATGRWTAALELFASLSPRRLAPDAATLLATLAATARGGAGRAWRRAAELLRGARSRGLKPESWSARGRSGRICVNYKC